MPNNMPTASREEVKHKQKKNRQSVRLGEKVILKLKLLKKLSRRPLLHKLLPF
jgi:hypothetical protein